MEEKSYNSFRSRWDRSTWLIICLIAACCIVPCFLDDGWIPVVISAAVMVFVLTAFRSIHYCINGENLEVYQLFTHKSYPVKEIIKIIPTKITTSAPAASLTHRLAITFSPSSPFSSPLIISPDDPERFITALLSINPHIKY